MSDRVQAEAGRQSAVRLLAAVGVGLAGCLLIWVVTPYNNYVLRNSWVADSFLPPAGLAVILIVVLGINPLLRCIRPGAAMTRRQLALIVGIILVGCCVPASGLHRQAIHSIAKVPLNVNGDANVAAEFARMNLPPELFTDRLGYGLEARNSESFIRELLPGESVDWSAWVGPLLSWGPFLLAGWLMMMGLVLIVMPQWRQSERLAFPLLTVYGSMIEEPPPGRIFSPIFRQRSFWGAALGVLALYLLSGLNQYFPESVPAVPLEWNLGSLFTEGPLAHLPGHIYNGRLYFIFLGIAFFMPTRISFSIWFFTVAYAGYQVVGVSYFPPWHHNTIYEHRYGAMLVVAASIVWIGRAQWGRVFASLFRRPVVESDRYNRRSGLMFLAGCAGMFAWMIWIGVQPGWAAFYVVFAFMVSILIARIVAETGMPFVRVDTRYHIPWVNMAPVSWLSPVSLWFSYVMAMLFPTASRVSFATMAAHGIGLEEAETPRRQVWVGWLFVAVMLAGMAICGAVHVNMASHYSTSLNGLDQPLNPWGTQRLDEANKALLELNQGQLSRPIYNQPAHMLFGAALAAVLQVLCLLTPRWPLHPVGLIMVQTFNATEAWASVMFGWMLKVVLVKFGGARLYRAARPFFLGMIMGEVFAGVIWSVVPAVLVAMGQDYKAIQMQPY